MHLSRKVNSNADKGLRWAQPTDISSNGQHLHPSSAVLEDGAPQSDALLFKHERTCNGLFALTRQGSLPSMSDYFGAYFKNHTNAFAYLNYTRDHNLACKLPVAIGSK